MRKANAWFIALLALGSSAAAFKELAHIHWSVFRIRMAGVFRRTRSSPCSRPHWVGKRPAERFEEWSDPPPCTQMGRPRRQSGALTLLCPWLLDSGSRRLRAGS